MAQDKHQSNKPSGKPPQPRVSKASRNTVAQQPTPYGRQRSLKTSNKRMNQKRSKLHGESTQDTNDFSNTVTNGIFAIVPADTDEQARKMERLMVLYRDAISSSSDEELEQLVDQVTPVIDIQQPVALLSQARRNAQLRAAFLKKHACLTSAEVHQLSGSKASNVAAYASGLRKSGRVFVIEYHGNTLYPAFQFNTSGKPKPTVRDVLTLLGHKMSGWELAIWFTTKNKKLSNKAPLSLMDTAPEAVLMAARALVEDNLY